MSCGTGVTGVLHAGRHLVGIVLIALSVSVGAQAVFGVAPVKKLVTRPSTLPVSIRSAAGTVKFEDTIAQRTLACTGCHGPQGRAGPDGYYPRIAGKPVGYLYNQLLNMREGRRHYAPMTSLLDPLSNTYLLEIAQYFSTLDLPYPSPLVSAATSGDLKRGQTLALHGDVAHNIPACGSCHGKALTGVAPNVPGLLGLPRDYLNAQLGGWQTGQRQAHAPDCMAQIAKRLTANDVTAVASWLASQPVPSNNRPAAVPPKPKSLTQPDSTKIACGSAMLPTTSTQATPAAAPSNELISRGAYLAKAGNCMGCHTTRTGAAYAGGRAIDTPFGRVYSSNLTPDNGTGLGQWRSDDFWGALHHGVSKDGRRLYPAFPYTNYTQVVRADSDALFAYLRSLPAAVAPNTPHALRWPYSTQVALMAWRALYFSPGEYRSTPHKSAEWNRGAYLVQGLGHCNACHATRNSLGATGGTEDLAGGQIPMQNWYAPSLTSNAEASLAAWDTSHVVALLKTGTTSKASVLGPMADVVLGSTQHLTDPDLNAIARYLKDLPQAPAATPPAVITAVPEKKTDLGTQLYNKYCTQCHGDKGQGVPGAYPPLAGNRSVTLANSANLLQIVIHGGFAPATVGNPRPYGMPPYRLQLNDADIAAVVTHIRTSWGNRASQVNEMDVGLLKSASKP